MSDDDDEYSIADRALSISVSLVMLSFGALCVGGVIKVFIMWFA